MDREAPRSSPSGLVGDRDQRWTQQTQDRWFYAYFVLSGALLMRVFWPYLMVLLFASVTVVVAWPLYVRVLERCAGRRAVASVLTTLLLGGVVFGPLTLLGYLFALEAVQFAGPAVQYLSQMRVEDVAADVQGLIKEYQDPRIAELIDSVLPADFNPLAAVLGPVKDAALGFLNAAGLLVPLLINRIVNGSIDAAIFVAAVVSLFMEGPSVLRVIRNLSPMEDRYEARLFEVFREFATNMAVGSVATAAAMGLVAGIGYAICGVDGVIFFGILTAVFSFVPVVGAMVIWVPLTFSVFIQHGWVWGVFLALWSILFTGTIDNILKPFFLRGSSNIHPLLIFLAVFGGMAWMGLPGVLVGPTIVAFFLALYTIYVADFLGLEPQVDVPGVPNEVWDTEPDPQIKTPTGGASELDGASSELDGASSERDSASSERDGAVRAVGPESDTDSPAPARGANPAPVEAVPKSPAGEGDDSSVELGAEPPPDSA